jgi:hypothetical protein
MVVVVVVVRDHCGGGEKEKNLGDFVVSCLVGNDLIPPGKKKWHLFCLSLSLSQLTLRAWLLVLWAKE